MGWPMSTLLSVRALCLSSPLPALSMSSPHLHTPLDMITVTGGGQRGGGSQAGAHSEEGAESGEHGLDVSGVKE